MQIWCAICHCHLSIFNLSFSSFAFFMYFLSNFYSFTLVSPCHITAGYFLQTPSSPTSGVTALCNFAGSMWNHGMFFWLVLTANSPPLRQKYTHHMLSPFSKTAVYLSCASGFANFHICTTFKYFSYLFLSNVDFKFYQTDYGVW